MYDKTKELHVFLNIIFLSLIRQSIWIQASQLWIGSSNYLPSLKITNDSTNDSTNISSNFSSQLSALLITSKPISPVVHYW